jgi:hypothetical protein
MRRHVVALGLLLVCGCPDSSPSTLGGEAPGPSATPATASPNEPTAQAALLAKAIREHPERAEGLLKKAGMSPDQFDLMMYDIAMDEEKTATFERSL